MGGAGASHLWNDSRKDQGLFKKGPGSAAIMMEDRFFSGLRTPRGALLLKNGLQSWERLLHMKGCHTEWLISGKNFCLNGADTRFQLEMPSKQMRGGKAVKIWRWNVCILLHSHVIGGVSPSVC